MKKIFTLLLLLVVSLSYAQNRSGLGISYLMNDYYSLQTDEFTLWLRDDTSTFATHDGGLRLSYWKELSRWFDVSANFNISRVDAPISENDSNFILRRWNNYSSNEGYNFCSSYKKTLAEFDGRVNLNILDKTRYLFNPYIFAGVTLDVIEDWGANVPVGFGTHVNVNERLAMNFEGGRRFSITKAPELDRNQFSAGLIWYLGAKEPKQPKVVDADGDGVNDDVDLCPTVAGLVQFNGCPDTDGDGIEDSKDDCPSTAGLPEFNGCPNPDSDGDGIKDVDDKCPNVAGLAKYDGCPVPDTDGDGFNDDIDKCPEVASPDNNGCPVIKKEVVEKISKAAGNIHFETNKYNLTEDSYEHLDIIADLLRDNPTYKCDIAGHTDSKGSRELNLNLSNERAKVCYDYLVNKGIDASRLSYKGYGPDNPVADNATADGRAKNRRTEFNLHN